jgi:hypothetical protein
VNVPLVPTGDELELGTMDMEELLGSGSTMELLLATLGEETIPPLLLLLLLCSTWLELEPSELLL